MANKGSMARLQYMAEAAAARKRDPARHRCFVSYHAEDMDEVEKFIVDFGSEFFAQSVGVTIEDDFVESDNEEYIKRRIRDKYLSGTTVTILLLGKCTWSRKFVDWEISSSLRNDFVNKRNGLLVYPLPSMDNMAQLPSRVLDNWVENSPTESYARYQAYPTSPTMLRSNIEQAFSDRSAKQSLVDNSRALRSVNSAC